MMDSDIQEVANALTTSSAAIRERQQVIDREQSVLRAADRAKDEFLAMLGHELRNPLGAVSNAASLLQREDLAVENRAAALSIIVRQTEQLTRLVNDLLDVGRVVAGKILLERHRVNLLDIAHAAVSAIVATGRAEGHRISIDGAGPIVVQGDQARLEQVVTNLVSNAITYSPPGGSVDVVVACDGGAAVLTVTDTGIGLRPEEHDAIFELFYQVDSGLHRKGGLGIGLTLVKRLVEMQGAPRKPASTPIS